MTTQSPQETVLPEPQAWRALAALCLGFFMILLDQTIVAVATPQFQTQLDASLNQVVWVTSIYLLCIVVPLLFTGRLGDRFGQRTVYQIGVGVFTLAAIACALAPTIEVLIAARAVQGLGAAILTPQTMSVINRVFARHRRGRALGAWGAVGSVASLVGPVLGGFIVGTFGWRGIFFLHVPVGLLALVLAGRWVPTLPTYARRIDVPSVAVSFVAMAAIVFAIQQGPELGWPAWVWGLLAAGLILVVVFVRLQTSAGDRGSEPLVPLSIFRNRNYSLGAFSIATMGFTVSSMMLPIMIWLQAARGLSAEQAGLMMVPMAVVAMVLSPLVGPLADRYHPRLLSMLGFGLMAGSLLTAWAIMRSEVPTGWFLAAAALMGLGSSFVWAPNSTTTMRDVEIAHMGAASGVYNTTRQTGSVLGAAAVGAGMQIGVARAGLATGMADALLLPALVLVLGFVAVSFFRADLPAATHPAGGGPPR
ncbi:MFS transporter [Corynebacterium halotolerans]|uniref:Permease of the major facilitator superfamily protein n=1 Tax=Corynebacterium halotolerans YIM 70093 = DSM 44683 TaxID=1121362 RepID=M1P6J3_9CORY|nr:MFS transporter [Corynebacterium halotolerans]AGF72281.1 permease of the major facilitator superfamily protein [Corynebacterium halotolerans YIM 70093 = DSM 44683]